MKLNLTLLALAGLLVFAGCKKDKDDATPNNPQQTTNKELIVGKNWKLTGAKAFLGDSIDVYNDPTYSVYVGCYKDDIITYNADGTYTLNNGGTVCDPPLQTSGTWELSADQKTLTLDKDTDNARTLSLLAVSSTTIIANTTFPYQQLTVSAKGTFTAQ